MAGLGAAHRGEVDGDGVVDARLDARQPGEQLGTAADQRAGTAPGLEDAEHLQPGHRRRQHPGEAMIGIGDAVPAVAAMNDTNHAAREGPRFGRAYDHLPRFDATLSNGYYW